MGGGAGDQPPLGLHIVMGAGARERVQNLLANIESGAVTPTLMMARRSA